LTPFEQNAGLDISKVLALGGPVSKAYQGFEKRPQQLQMARAVKRTFENGGHIAIEAGTGVGKSFAYLVAAIDQVLRRKTRILVSTFTITLQEQLINKDIPFLRKALGRPFTAVLAKGRGNYLCLRRLDFAKTRQERLFDDFGTALAELSDWARQTQDGSLSDLASTPSMELWDAVRSEHGNCRSRKCPHFKKCFYWRARRRLECADIIVANHALLFSDLVLKQEFAGILPEYKFVIIDEAHNIEHVAEEHFGINISNYTLTFLLNGLYNARTHKGVLAYTNSEKAIDLVRRCGKAAKTFFAQVKNWYEENKDQTNGRSYANFVEDNITEPIKKLRLALAQLAKQKNDNDEKFELTRYIDRCIALERDLIHFLIKPQNENVYWVEVTQGRRTRVCLRSAPVNVGPSIKQCLFDSFESVILTSATLSTDSSDHRRGFEFFAGRIGLEDFDALKLGSPFDYQRQVTMYIEPNLPEPNDKAFEAAAAKAIKKYIRLTRGKAFVLFTSYAMLKKTAEKLAGWLEENDIPLLQQAAGLDRSTLLKLFKADTDSVLFGTDSFWQGVDVPGEALSNVIIMRLPFAVPDHPLLQGKLEQIRLDGENPFFKYQLPRAVIKFKQGFGRLIRNKTDTGIIVVLDSRIVRKSYGRQFLTAIPKCRVKKTGKLS